MGTSGLGNLLVEDGLLTEADRRTIRQTCGNRPSAFAKSIIALGLLDEEELAAFISERSECRVAPKNLADEASGSAIDAVDEPLLQQLEVLPVTIEGKTLTVAMADPLDAEVVRQLEFFTGLRIKPIVATFSQIFRGLKESIESFDPKKSDLDEFLTNHAISVTRRLQLEDKITRGLSDTMHADDDDDYFEDDDEFVLEEDEDITDIDFSDEDDEFSDATVDDDEGGDDIDDSDLDASLEADDDISDDEDMSMDGDDSEDSGDEDLSDDADLADDSGDEDLGDMADLSGDGEEPAMEASDGASDTPATDDLGLFDGGDDAPAEAASDADSSDTATDDLGLFDEGDAAPAVEAAPADSDAENADDATDDLGLFDAAAEEAPAAEASPEATDPAEDVDLAGLEDMDNQEAVAELTGEEPATAEAAAPEEAAADDLGDLGDLADISEDDGETAAAEAAVDEAAELSGVEPEPAGAEATLEAAVDTPVGEEPAADDLGDLADLDGLGDLGDLEDVGDGAELDAIVEEPVIEEPVIEEPAVEEAASEELSADDLDGLGDLGDLEDVGDGAEIEASAEEPASDEPVMDDPAIDDPAIDDPAIDDLSGDLVDEPQPDLGEELSADDLGDLEDGLEDELAAAPAVEEPAIEEPAVEETTTPSPAASAAEAPSAPEELSTSQIIAGLNKVLLTLGLESDSEKIKQKSVQVFCEAGFERGVLLTNIFDNPTPALHWCLDADGWVSIEEIDASSFPEPAVFKAALAKVGESTWGMFTDALDGQEAGGLGSWSDESHDLVGVSIPGADSNPAVLLTSAAKSTYSNEVIRQLTLSVVKKVAKKV